MQHLNIQKSNLRKIIKELIKNIPNDEKCRQSDIVVSHLLRDHPRFAAANNIAIYVAMKNEEIDTIPLIEAILKNTDKLNQKKIYLPHIQMVKSESQEMEFYELESYQQYINEMNDDNKFKLKQFNNVEKLKKCDPSCFDLIICPGLLFEFCQIDDTATRRIARLGRGKGYYDRYLSKIPKCYTIGVGFNQQLVNINDELVKNNFHVPISNTDALLNEFVCEMLIKQ
jgi:5-formyltetrahydrofolate cyclo-ligase